MKRLMFVGLVLGVLISHAQPVHGQEPIDCILNGGILTCDLRTPTPIPTSTPTALPTSTPTPQPTPTSTPSPSPTATSSIPTATPTPTSQSRPLPPKAADGTYYLTQPGTYSGNATCGNIGGGAHCVHIWNSNGVTLQDFTIVSGQGYGLQFDNNNTILRGTITAPLGASGFHKVNVTFDSVAFNVQTVALQLIGSGCENTTPRPNRNITVRASEFKNQSGFEMLYLKCAQDVRIEGNGFTPKSDWAVSLPDGVNVSITGNTFDLTSEPGNWLGIELPRVFGAKVADNTAQGPAGDWLGWHCCGSTNLSFTGNVLAGGMGELCCILPPSTGDGGLR